MASPSTTPARRRARAAIAAAIVPLLLAGACSSGDGEDEASTGATDAATVAADEFVRTQNLEGDTDQPPEDGGSLVIGIEAETDGFNPIANRWAASGHFVGSAVFDPLTTIDEEGNMIPYLAESLTPNDDATSWEIKVRAGVTFHDGTPLTSQAVKDTFDGHLGSIITSAALSSVSDVEIVDDLTVRVNMSEPWVQFPSILASQVGYVVAPSMITDLDTARQPVGTGPFTFEVWDEDVSFVARRYEDYWQEGKPHLDQIEFRPIPDSSERLDALRSGEIDMMHTIRASDIAALREDPDIKMVEVSFGEEAFLSLNTQQPPFDRREARLAVAHATDVDRYLDETGRAGVAVPARGVFAPGQLGYREDNGYPEYDIDLARQYAAEYEAATGEPLSFTYKGSSSVENLQSQQSLQAMWAEAGIDVQISTVEQDTQILDAALGNYQLIDFRNFGATEPDGEFVWWTSRSVAEPGGVALNFPRFADPEIDAALLEARATDDQAARDEAYALIARRLNEESPYVWLERATWALAANPRVHGIGAAANGTLSTLGAKVWLADLWVSRSTG